MKNQAGAPESRFGVPINVVPDSNGKAASHVTPKMVPIVGEQCSVTSPSLVPVVNTPHTPPGGSPAVSK
jgi:hypothetical protein